MRIVKYVAEVMIVGCMAASVFFGAQQAQKETAATALKKANVTDRLIERTPPRVSASGTAPSFVVDPAWPKPLPHNWIIGDVGGLFVDRHDHVWVYHRPRALVSSDAGAIGVGIRQGWKSAASLGRRSCRSGLSRQEVPPAGWLLLALS